MKKNKRLCDKKEGEKMEYRVPGQCPVCGKKLIVTKLSCQQCHTRIEGEFNPCEFCHLSKDELRFLKTFIQCQGNIKEMEKELGISYPTVKGKLKHLVKTLESYEQKACNQEEVLNQLEAGKITAEEATEQLRKCHE